MNAIEDWYDNQYDEWSRLDRHRIEFEITKRYLNHYITGASQKILDIGGGPGRYSFYLAERGHKVSLLDLSQKHINIAKQKSEELGINLDQYVKGDALDLSDFEAEEFDVVLLMGPLYHLTSEEDRKKSLSEATRVLKKGGLLIASFISKYAPLQEAFAYLDLGEQMSDMEDLFRYLDDGENNDGNGFTTAYFTGIEEAEGFMAAGGLKQLAFAGAETVILSKERELTDLPQEQFDRWIDFCYRLSQDRSLLGSSMHFIYVGEK